MSGFLALLWSFFQVGLFSFGGGYAALMLIKEQVVTIHHWLSMTQFTDIITISQMTPGPIAINSATFVGIQVKGIPGALVATLGCIIPSCIIVILLAYLYDKYKELPILKAILSGLRPAVVALIATAGMAMLMTAFYGSEAIVPKSWLSIDWIAVLLFAGSLLVLRKWKPDPIMVMIASGIVGAVLYLL